MDIKPSRTLQNPKERIHGTQIVHLLYRKQEDIDAPPTVLRSGKSEGEEDEITLESSLE